MKRIRPVANTLLWLYVILHALLIVYDVSQHDLWLRADRANERVAQMADLSRIGDWQMQLAYVGHHYVPGDYLIQSILYNVGGLFLLLLAQVALCVLSVVCVYRMACSLLGKSRLSLLTAGLYALLPQTLIFPHQLSAEAWFVPFVVFSVYYMTRWFSTRATNAAVLSGLYWACATLTRPTVIPFALLSALAFRRGASANSRAAYYLALLIPVVAWVITVHAYTGKLSFGEGTSATTGNNLMLKARFISDPFPPEAKERAQRHIDPVLDRDRRMTIPEYARFCAEFLGPCAAQVGQDAINFFLKSGIERITLDYLGLIPEDERRETQYARPGSPKGWAQVFRDKGAVGAAKFYLERYPVVVGTSLLATLAFGMLTFAYMVGAIDALISLMKHKSEDGNPMLALLAIFPIYLFAASSVVSSMQSRHRAAAEFAMLIVAGNGWRAWRRWLARRSAPCRISI
jgi:hypothetical protein